MIDINRVYELEIDISSVSNTKTKIEFKQFDYNACLIKILYHKKGDLIENIKNNTVIGVFKMTKVTCLLMQKLINQFSH